ncbi:MAG: 23S rRNA (guanosine(2251)-2'-O)-methyltransferase RlmB [Bacilli bacterium]|nr:23S rRNA (guanosine(2251)-2'-O)-methyltransferase RlmB [Bacilli bacterium]
MYIYGKNVAEETLKKNEKIKKAFIYTEFKDQNILSALQKKNITIKLLSKRELDTLANANHQGIILDVPDYVYADIDVVGEEEELILLLDHLEDPHNFGAIIRTAEAAGIKTIIIPKDRSVEVNATVMKVSAGAIHNMQIVMVTNLVQTMKYLQKKGFWFVGTDMEGTSYDKIDYRGKMGIVIGNEGKGMSDLTSKTCDFIATIPMNGNINSLNASVAAGIVIFEAMKQRK